MILTKKKIIEEIADGNISIDPFILENVNPNSYNYRLGSTLKVGMQKDDSTIFETVFIPKTGYVLQPGILYLGTTLEKIGSNKFSMSLIGRSSLGRLGLFLQISANLGHTGSNHCWTLEMYCCKPIRIYPEMKIGQVSFWVNQGIQGIYSKYYAKSNLPLESNLFLPTDIAFSKIVGGVK
ncbi:MAG: hypothetical protein L6Q37_12250 [Bdellovibrionaceae bacterium]|nr:hypothetical protein [Pseudobdellovibrionaceae bacterium]NUM60483.1 deoxycytidine deaminase [Pseudobdellovibrionaceae bacterium]